MEGRFNGRFLRHRFGGLIFGGTYTWRGLFSEFYGSVLIEQGILVLPHSRTPTVDVRISFANRTTGGLREPFSLVRYLVGRPFCNLAVCLDPGYQSIRVSNPPPLTCLPGLRERAHSDSVLVKYTQYLQYIITTENDLSLAHSLLIINGSNK